MDHSKKKKSRSEHDFSNKSLDFSAQNPTSYRIDMLNATSPKNDFFI